MTSEQWNRIQVVFDSLVDLPPGERVRALAQCAVSESDSQILEEVERLLSHADQSIFVDDAIPGISALRSLGAPRVPGGFVLANRFQITRFLGRGGMGEVYEALDLDLGETVALKTLRPDLVSTQEMVGQFFREVQLARRVTHVNACRIFDLGRGCDPAGQEIVFLTMEFVPGETLATWLKRPTSTLAPKLAILRHVIAGVRAAHAAGVLHCDLKPGNVIVSETPAVGLRAVVTDFGLARVLPAVADFTGPSVSQNVFGTPAYLAPEQVEGQRITAKTDVYSLGLLMYETISGSLPFANEPGIALLKRMSRVPPAPSTFAPDLAAEWDNAVLRCLHPDPERRFPSVDALAEAVDGSRPARFHLKLSRRTLLAASGSLLAAGAVATWKAVGGWPDWNAPTGNRVLLTPISYPTDEPQLGGLTALFASQLSQSAHITAVDPNSVPDLLKMVRQQPGKPLDPATARHVTLRLQIPLVMFGGVLRVGSEYVLNIILEQMNGSSVQPRRSWPYMVRARNRAELMEAVHDGARWVRLRLGESSASVAALDRSPAEATTASWEALQKLALAEQAKADDDRNLAVACLKEAIALDPQFALAYMRLGDILFNLNRFQEGIVHWRHANELAANGKLTTREQLRIRGLYCSELERFAEAESCFAEYAKVFPADDLGPFYLAYALRMQMRLKESMDQLWEAERRRGGAYYTSSDRANCCLLANDRVSLRREIERLRSAGHGSAANRFEGTLAAIEGDAPRAEGIFRQMLSNADPQARAWAATRLAYLWSESDRNAEAAGLIRASVEEARGSGDSQIVANRLTTLAWLEWRKGDVRACRQACAAAATLPLVPSDFVRLGAVMARSGNLKASQWLANRLKQEYGADFPVALKKIQVENATAGSGTSRKDLVREVLELDREDPAAHCREYVAYVLWAVGRKAEAAARYREIVERPHLLWHEVDVMTPGIQADARERIA